MKIVLAIALLISFCACKPSSPTYKLLSTCDSLVINFNEPNSNILARTVTTTNPIAVEKLARFVDAKSTGFSKCGYDGNLMFYKEGILSSDVSFNFSGDGCHHFIMYLGNQLHATEMSNEAADFLKSLSEGKDWY